MILALILTPSAEALSCMYGGADGFPADGAADVPVDVIPRMSVFGAMDSDPVLVDVSTEERVAISVELLTNPGDTHTVWLRPDAPLSPSTTYSLVTFYGDEPLEDAWTHSTFTTGETESDGSIDAPVLLDADRDRGRDMWGRWDWLSMTVDSASATYRVQVASSDDFSDATEADVIGYDSGSDVSLSVGSGLCSSTLELPTGRSFVRIAAIDYAGNVSEYSEAQSAGCSAVPRQASLLSALAGLLAVIGGRRRRANDA